MLKATTNSQLVILFLSSFIILFVGIEFDYSFCVHLLTNKNICASIRA